MRTKQTGKKVIPPVNGTMPSATPKHMQQQVAPAEMKSPAQPPELSQGDKQKMKAFLDKHEKPFTVRTLSNTASSKKRKRGDEQASYVLQEDLWEERLSVQYQVKPRERWESLRRYKKFTGESHFLLHGYGISD